MPSSSIEDFIAAHKPCIEGVERLEEHASMADAWDASKHGPFLLYIIKHEGVDPALVDAVRAVKAHHGPVVRKARRAALDKDPQGEARLQDLDEDYAAALGAYADALKEIVANPFQ